MLSVMVNGVVNVIKLIFAGYLAINYLLVLIALDCMEGNDDE